MDLDGDGRSEVVDLRRAGDGYELVVCAADELVGRVSLPDEHTELWGFVDLDDDGSREVLMQTTTATGTTLGAVTYTLRGLALTDLAAQRWVEDVGSGRLFDASAYECRDVDEDGDLELLVVSYRPAETLEHLDVARIDLDGTTATQLGLDSYETDVTTARARWSRTTCTDAPADVGVVHGTNGWQRVEYGEAFGVDGDVVLTGIAHARSVGRYVAAGYVKANPMLDTAFDIRPAIWWSPDALSWHPAELDSDDGEIRSVAALADGTGFVAVGRTVARGAVWISSGGATWELTEIPPSRPGGRAVLWDIDTSATDLLVAVGHEGYPPDRAGAGEDRDPAVWTSTDGRTWRHIDDLAFGQSGYQPNTAGEFNGELVGVAHADGIGWVAVGSASTQDDPEIDYPLQRPAAWTSQDAQSWQRHHLPGEFQLRGVTASGSGFLAYGVTDLQGAPDSDAMLVTSPDGADWTPAAGGFDGLGPADGIQAINAALTVPDVGTVAVGSDEQEFETRGGAAVWWSHPASGPWTRESHDDTVFETLDSTPSATMTDATWDGQRLVVVGFTGSDIELPNGHTGCCVIAPAIWLWPAPGSG